ncbi:MAG: serine/threonine-protein kinase [Thermoanaerobaculia bacterium]|nr:serine/threonine-protein kinase [Thermoanaerobaculia bacterium]
MRRAVEELVAAHEGDPDFLARPLLLERDLVDDRRSGSVEQVDIPPMLSPGQILADRFEVVRMLGRGGMGAVYEAIDRDLDTRVALKVLGPEIARDPGALERFRRETTLARRVTHPNACRIYDLFRHGDGPILSMELLEGETLAERLRRQGPMSPAETLPIAQQVAAGLDAGHRVGVVHRDVKSGNVMLVEGPQGERAVVTDFGLATSTRTAQASALHLTRTGQILGTPAFMSPEQLEGRETTPATDVYGLGVVIFEMLTGKLPFDGDSPYTVAARQLREETPSPRRFLPDLDRRWERVILACLERDAADRFQRTTEVVAALKGERKVPSARRASRLARRGVVAAAILLAAAIALLWPRWMGRSPPEESRGATAVEARVLIADFDNRTGDPALAGLLESAVARALAAAPSASLVPEEQIARTLRLMRKPPDARIDVAMGREICLRDGIRALLTGRIDTVGSSYLVSVNLVDPQDGSVVAAMAEEAGGPADLADAVHRLAARVGESLREEIQRIRDTQRGLQRASTDSLRALELHTEAEAAAGDGDYGVAEELFRLAIDEDPEFASAHILLMWSIYNQGRPPEEYLPYGQRALALADGVADWERFFIRGSFHQVRGEYERAADQYAAVLRLQPSYFYYGALRSLYWLKQRLGRPEEFVPYALRATTALPEWFEVHAFAAQSLVETQGRLGEAERYARRASELMTAEDLDSSRWEGAWVLLFPVHRGWVENDPEAALAELGRVARRLPKMSSRARVVVAQLVGFHYEYLGKLAAAEEIYLQIPDDDTRRYVLWRLELERREVSRWGEVLRTYNPPYPGASEVVFLARAGLAGEARELLASLEVPTEPNTRALRLWAGGELALAAGNAADAIPLLVEGVEALRGNRLAHSFFWAAGALAEAWRQQGNVERALEVLLDAARQKGRAFSGKSGWTEVRLQLAELYRHLGRDADARAVEEELRGLLRYADADYRLLRRLEHLSPRPGLEAGQ